MLIIFDTTVIEEHVLAELHFGHAWVQLLSALVRSLTLQPWTVLLAECYELPVHENHS
jgi:hypothetical protein